MLRGQFFPSEIRRPAPRGIEILGPDLLLGDGGYYLHRRDVIVGSGLCRIDECSCQLVVSCQKRLHLSSL